MYIIQIFMDVTLLIIKYLEKINAGKSHNAVALNVSLPSSSSHEQHG